MKKILILFMVFCLSGCIQSQPEKKTSEEKPISQGIIDDIEKVMPQDVFNELNNNGVYTEADNTIILSNAKNNPSLRLDFTYQDNQLIQYDSKEYGFVDGMKDNKINEQQSKDLAKLFAKTFLEQENTFTKTSDLSGYDDGNYITLEDQNKNIYTIQLNKNMIIKYINHTQL